MQKEEQTEEDCQSNDVVKFVQSDPKCDLSVDEINTKVLPMMKFLGTRVHKHIDVLATKNQGRDAGNFQMALAYPKSALHKFLKKDKYSTYKELKLKPRWIWDMYEAVMALAMPGLYLLSEPINGKGQIVKDADDKYDDRQYRINVNKLFGPDMMQ